MAAQQMVSHHADAPQIRRPIVFALEHLRRLHRAVDLYHAQFLWTSAGHDTVSTTPDHERS